MDYTSVFYWLTVADNARLLFQWGAGLFSVIAVIATICNLVCRGESDEKGQSLSRKWIWWSYPFMFLWWILLIFTPSKKDALLIVAGGQTLNFLTTDKTAKQIPHEALNFVMVELKNMASDAKVDLNINEQKEKILNEAKNMSPKEVLERASTDSTFQKIILNK